jgi:hypothetical protein
MYQDHSYGYVSGPLLLECVLHWVRVGLEEIRRDGKVLQGTFLVEQGLQQ